MKTTIAAIILGALLTGPMLTHAQVQSGRIATVDLDRTFKEYYNTLNGVPGLVYSQDSIEITDDIVKILNKNKPADLPKLDEKKTDKPVDKKSDKPADKK